MLLEVTNASGYPGLIVFICKLTLTAFFLSAVEKLEEALQCALTYQLFHEEEEFVMENVDYYREVLGHDGKPREVRICCYCGVETGRWLKRQ